MKTRRLPPHLIERLVEIHRPRGWRVVQTRRQSGTAHPTGRKGCGVLRVPVLVDVYAITIFLHECGHVHLGHFEDWSHKAPHVEEMEAEIYAWHTMAAHGLPMPRWLKTAGQVYVATTLKADLKKGWAADERVIRWLGTTTAS